MATPLLVIFLISLSLTSGKVSLYLSSDQTEALYGIKTPGLYYITEGVVNKYAMNFQHQVIPAEVDHIDFTWQAKKGSAVPYKITFMHAPSKAMDNPSVNISTEGIVPTHTDKFRLLFPCTGKLAEQVETLFQISFSIRRKAPEVLNFKRIKVCKARDPPLVGGGMVSDTLSAEEENDPAKSVLLSSVSPSLFVTLGAVSASVILLTVVVAVIYIKRVRKRESQVRVGSSLRSSLELSPEEEYLEKRGGSHCTVTLSSSDSYDTLASFTQLPVGGHRSESSWATVNHYASPIIKPSFSSWRRPGEMESLSTAASPLMMRQAGPSPRWGQEVVQGRRVRPSAGGHHQYQYSTVGQAGPGEASPYSVSSELYKHVLPPYLHTSRGSVLV